MALFALIAIGLTALSISVFLNAQASPVVVAIFPFLDTVKPQDESVPWWLLWVIQSLAWLGTLTILFAILFVFNVFKVRSKERSLVAQQKVISANADLIDTHIQSFFRNCLQDQWYGIAKCYAFGSVVGKYPTRDVDIVVQFDSSVEREVRNYRGRMRTIERNFQGMYNLNIRLQTFLSTEDEAVQSFLGKAGVYQRLK